MKSTPIHLVLEFSLFIYILFSGTTSFSQSDLISDFNKYNEFFSSGKYDLAIKGFESIENKLLTNGDTIYYLYALNYKVATLLQVDSLQIAISENDKLVKFYDNLNDNCDFWLKSDINIHYCRIYHKLGNHNLAKFYFDKALKYISYGEGQTYKMATIYQDGGFLSLLLGDYDNSIKYFFAAINETYSDPNQIKSTWYSSIGYCYSKLKIEDEAIKYFNLSDSILKSYDTISNHNSLAFNILNMNRHHLEQNSLDELYALDTIPTLNIDNHRILNYYQLKSKSKAIQNNNISAKNYLDSAIIFFNNHFKYNKYKLAETFLLNSEIYLELGDLNTSNNLISSSLTSLYPNSKDNLDHKSCLNQRLAVKSILQKIIILYKLNKNNEANNLVSDLLYLLDYNITHNIQSINSKLYYLSTFKSDHSNLISLVLNNKNISKAFEISQKLHGSLLSKELFFENESNNFNIPPEYLEYEENLKVKISKIEHMLLRSNNDNIAFDSLLLNLNYIKGELDILIKNIENANPAYHELKYSIPPTMSVEFIQKNILKKSSALIEYFLSEENLYTFLITKKGLEVTTSEIDTTFTNHIFNLNNHIRSLNSEVTYNSFVQSSEYLYQKLLGDVKDKLGPEIDHLYIIPDNEINYIPFSVLFENASDDIAEGRYDLLPYLAKDYNISYHYSSALLDSENTNLSGDLSSFAPSFTSDYSNTENLDQLLHNQEEILLINDIADGQIHVDTSANLPNLRRSFNQYKIAHLATHATCNDTLPFESKIHMEDGPLYAYEIYNMPHDLDLAVLSACQTGDGALKKGEGIMSLARAFISSGCKSVITSLWNVNDKNSSVLMTSFYEHLWAGNTVGSSLGQSKREYLNTVSSSLQAHPYNWATFIAIGNADMAIFRIPWGELCLLLFLVFLSSAIFLRIFS